MMRGVLVRWLCDEGGWRESVVVWGQVGRCRILVDVDRSCFIQHFHLSA